MSAQDLVKQYFSKATIMQLATTAGNQPWLCTLHYVSDDTLNLYWISRTDREHSKQLIENSHAAAYVLVHENTLSEDYVIGITVVGTAEVVDEVSPKVGQAYIQKHNKDPQLLADIISGKNPHKFYRLQPSKIVLFDSKNFPDNPRQELQI